MIKNYIKIAWRNLFRNRGFSITNLMGLTIGMTCTLLILLWVRDELTYDQFHSNYKNIYQIIANRDFKNQMFTDRSMVLPLATSLEATYPQIKFAVASTYNQDHVLASGNTKLTKNGITVSAHFFNMFSWKFLKGNPATALKDPSSIVLTASTARALFGDSDPINRILSIDNENNYKVAAVLEDPPGNSTIQFDYVNTFNYSDASVKRSMNEWTNSSWVVYVQPLQGTNLTELTKNINNLKSQHDPEDKISSYFIFPMNKWRLYNEFKDGKVSGGMIVYVKLFSIIAVIILLTACVNFMNLSTARSEKELRR